MLILVLPLVSLLASVVAHAASEPVCITKSNVSLRKGPGTKFPVSWAVPKYMPFLALERKGAWVKVQDLDGKTHWVRSNAISSKLSCAVVKTKTAKLRQGPGDDQPLAELATASKYTAFLRVDRDGEWIQVKDDFEGMSWIHETNVWIPTVRARVSF